MTAAPAPKPKRAPSEAKVASARDAAEAQRFAAAAIAFVNATTRLMTDAQNRIFADALVHHFRPEEPTRVRRK